MKQSLAYIRKIKPNRWRVFSEKGKNMGTFDSEEKAEKRLQQIEYFKYKNALLDLRLETKTAKMKMTFSSVMRELRQNFPDKILSFLKLFHNNLVQCIENKIADCESAALLQTLMILKQNEKF